MDTNNVKNGIVFNIVHGSMVDGYGIRTTIFLKGCPLLGAKYGKSAAQIILT